MDGGDAELVVDKVLTFNIALDHRWVYRTTYGECYHGDWEHL